MKSSLSSLLRKIFLSSLAGIAAKGVSGSIPNIGFYPSYGEESEATLVLEKENNLQPKLLLKKSNNDEWNVMAHRSHRSHSSHRSHYSSSSGGSSRSGSSSGSSRSGSSGSSSGSSNSGTSGTTVKPNSLLSPIKSAEANLGISATSLKLGARTLKLGMSGTDVTELINILLKKKYLKLDNGGTQVNGSYTYDETIEATVKQFQIDNGVLPDGVCGAMTVYHLKKEK